MRSQSRLAKSILTLALAVPVCLPAMADEGPENPGLRGILPDFVPEGLSEDDFLTLGDSWADWSREVAGIVATFYEEFELDAAGQRKTIDNLKRKLGVMEAALADTDYRIIHIPLTRLHARLKPRIALAEAIIDTLEGRTEAAEVNITTESSQKIAQAVDDLESYLAGIPDGLVWLDFVSADQLRQLPDGDVPLAVVTDVCGRLTNPNRLKTDEQRRFLKRPGFVTLRQQLDRYLDLQNRPTIQTVSAVDRGEMLREKLWELVDALEQHSQGSTTETSVRTHQVWEDIVELTDDNGHRIGAVLGEHYFNDNLRIRVSESFLSRIVGYSVEEKGDVDDFILGAVVTGTQKTTGKLAIDLQPGEKQIQFYMRLTGRTQSSTVGQTDEATVWTSGHHTFDATKAISFNGDAFRTAPAEMSVNANNTTTAARAKVGALLAPIANDIALREARRREPQSEAIAADRVRQNVLPEFNKGVEAQFAQLTTTLEKKVNPRLLDADLFPSRRSYTSTEDELQMDMRLMDTLEFGGSAAALMTDVEDAAVIHVHESMLNNAFSRLALSSLEMTEAELMATLTDSLGDLLPKGFKLTPPEDHEPDNTKFVFPEQDALRVKIDNDALSIILRTGLKPESGDEIPTQQITIPLTFSIDKGKLEIAADDVAVSAVDPPRSPFVQIARAGVVKAKMKESLPPRTVDASFEVDRGRGKPVELKITEIRANAGWLSIVIK